MASSTRGSGSVATQGLVQPTAPTAASPFNFKGVLQQMVQQNASDLHLKVGRPPTLRVQGDLVPLQMPVMKPEDLKSLAEQVMSPKQVKEFAEHKEADFAIGVPGIGRLRAIAYQAKTIAELNLPAVVEQIAMRPRGLVLVTGVTGSGKSTALASMIQ